MFYSNEDFIVSCCTESYTLLISGLLCNNKHVHNYFDSQLSSYAHMVGTLFRIRNFANSNQAVRVK